MQAIKTSIVAAACTATLLFAGSAFAAQTTTLTIAATVVSECKFTAGPYSMPFGNLSSTATADATMATTIGYQCTNGTAASSIKINDAASPTTVSIVSGAHSLPVHLTWATPTTAGAGMGGAFPTITATVNGTIAKSDINAAFAGVYTATYNVDLLP